MKFDYKFYGQKWKLKLQLFHTIKSQTSSTKSVDGWCSLPQLGNRSTLKLKNCTY